MMKPLKMVNTHFMSVRSNHWLRTNMNLMKKLLLPLAMVWVSEKFFIMQVVNMLCTKELIGYIQHPIA